MFSQLVFSLIITIGSPPKKPLNLWQQSNLPPTSCFFVNDWVCWVRHEMYLVIFFGLFWTWKHEKKYNLAFTQISNFMKWEVKFTGELWKHLIYGGKVDEKYVFRLPWAIQIGLEHWRKKPLDSYHQRPRPVWPQLNKDSMCFPCDFVYRKIHMRGTS